MTSPVRSALAMIASGATAVMVLVLVAVVPSLGWTIDQKLMLAWAYDDLIIGPVGTMVRPQFIVAAVAALVVVASLRRRPDLALAAVLLVGGATLSTQILKRYAIAPLATGENTLPSGHVTVVVSVLLAALLVAGQKWRPAMSALAGFLGALIAIGAMIGTWHLPGDVVAAAAVCLMWAGIVLAALDPAAHRFRRTPAAAWSSDPARQPRGLALIGALAAAGALTAYRGWANIPFGWFVASRLAGMLVALAIGVVVGWFAAALDDVD